MPVAPDARTYLIQIVAFEVSNELMFATEAEAIFKSSHKQESDSADDTVSFLINSLSIAFQVHLFCSLLGAAGLQCMAEMKPKGQLQQSPRLSFQVRVLTQECCRVPEGLMWGSAMSRHISLPGELGGDYQSTSDTFFSLQFKVMKIKVQLIEVLLSLCNVCTKLCPLCNMLNLASFTVFN